MFKFFVGTAAILSSVVLGKKLLSETATKLWEQISFSVPPSSFNVQFGLTSLLVTTDLRIANNNDLTVQVAGLSAILKYKNDQNELVEIGRTEPNDKTWTIAKRQASIIEGIQIKVGVFGAFKAAKVAMSKPEGQRLLVQFSGTINQLPLSYDYWY